LYYANSIGEVSNSIFIGNRGSQYSICNDAVGSGSAYIDNCIFIDNGNNLMYSDYEMSANNCYWGEIENPSFTGVTINGKYTLKVTGPSSFSIDNTTDYTISFTGGSGGLPALNAIINLDPVLGTISTNTLPVTTNENTFTITPTREGNTTIKVAAKQSSSTNLLTKDIEITPSTKKHYNLTINVANVLYSQPVIVNVNLKDEENSGVAGTVVVEINGKTYNVNTDNAGVGSTTITDILPVASYTAIANYTSQSSEYANAKAQTSFNVTINKYNLTIDTADVDYRDPITVNVTLKDVDGNGVTGTVVITLNNEKHNVSVNNGFGSLTFNDRTPAGTYVISASYNSIDPTYENATATTSITINDVPLKEYSLIINSPASVNISEEFDVGITLLNAEGNPVSGNVQLTFNGETKNITVTVGSGSTTLKSDVSGKFNITAKYISLDEKYKDAITTKTIKVIDETCGNFNELEELIKTGSPITLNKDYKLSNSEGTSFKNGISISNLVINGNGYTIDCKNDQGEQVRLFNLDNGGSLTLNNLNIINANDKSHTDPKKGSIVGVGHNANVNMELNNVNISNCEANEYLFYFNDGNIKIINSSFDFNKDIIIHISNLATLEVAGSQFINNTKTIFDNENGMGSSTISNSVFINNTGSPSILTSSSDRINNCIFINNKNVLLSAEEGYIDGSGNYFAPYQTNSEGVDVYLTNPANLTIEGNSTFSEEDSQQYTIKFSNTNLPTVNLGVAILNSNLGTIEPAVITISGNNEAKVTLTPKDYGNTSILVGPEYNNILTKNITINQSDYKKYDLEITTNKTVIYGDEIKIDIALKDANGAFVQGTSIINITIGDINKTIEITDGIGNGTITANLKAGVYDLIATYKSLNPRYKNATNSTEVTVEKAYNPISIELSNTTINDGQNVTVTATLNKPVQGISVQIYGNGKVIAYDTTDDDGKVNIKIAPSYGTYQIYAKTSENYYYNSSESSIVNLTVIPLIFTNLTLESSTDIIFTPSDVSFIGKLKDENGNVVANVPITIFKDDVEFLNLTTNNNGEISFNLTINNPGVTSMVAKYAGSETYYANSSNVVNVIYINEYNFYALSLLIAGSSEGSIVTLPGDFIFNPAIDNEFINGINITKDIIIDGNGYTISGNNTSSLFNIIGKNVEFKNINLIDAAANDNGAIAINNGELTITNSTIDNIKEGLSTNDKAVAIYSYKSDVNIINSTINNIESSNLPAIYLDNSISNIEGSEFKDIETGKAAISMRLGSANINNSTFEDIKNTGNGFGGVINTQNTALNINNSKFNDNSAKGTNGIGGVAMVNGGEVTVENTLFKSNIADINSGVLYGTSNANIKLINVTIDNNTAIGSNANSLGGAIFIDTNSRLDIINSTVINNKEPTNTVRKLWLSNGIILINKGGILNIEGSKFENNNATNSSVIELPYDGIITVHDSVFENNTGYQGIIYSSSLPTSNSVINNSTFINNKAVDGGAIYTWYTPIDNCIFINNTATNGGAISGFTLNVNSSLFINNTATNGGAISGSDINIKYNLFINNKGSNDYIIYIDNQGMQNDDYLDYNYWGTNNNPNSLVGLMNQSEEVRIHLNKWVTLNITGNNETWQHVSTDYEIKFVGDNADKLQSIDGIVKVNNDDVEIEPSDIIISSEATNTTLYSEDPVNVTMTVYYADIPLTTYNITFKEVIKKNYTFTITSDDVVYGSDILINFTLFDEDGVGLNKSIVFTFNNQEYSVQLINGKGNKVMPNFNAGKYEIKSNYTSEDFFYNNATASCNVTVFKAKTNIILTVTNVTYGENVTLKAYIGDEFEYEDLYFTIVNSTLVDNEPVPVDENGNAYLTLQNWNAGDYTLIVEFKGNDNYNGTTSNASFTVFKKEATMNITAPETFVQHNNNTVVVTVPSDATGEVVITIGNQEFKANVVKGVATVVVTNLNTVGIQNMSVKYSGDAKYNSSEKTILINITPKDKTVLITDDVKLYYKNGTRWVAILTTSYGKPIEGATLTFTINGQNYDRTTGADGSASMAINLNPDVYSCAVSYKGTNTSEEISKNVTVTVLSTVYGNNLTLYYRNGTKYNALFVDKQGNPLKNTKVTFNINGVMYERITDENGFTSGLTINLRQGTYIITAVNPVTGQSYSNVITVLPTIITKNIVKYYKNGTQFEAKVVDGHGNPLSGQKLTFNINGVFYSRTTNADGIAILNINLPPENYIITTECNGCTVSNTVDVLPVIIGRDFSTIY
ncbi:MAG: Ig-like domain repeat protein, partial [Methanobrevibacter sp.]|nr:Ig-like domain repeat protein [Methanobrevibacter sp.]